MKSTFAVVLLLGIVSTVALAQTYPKNLDHVNIETVLSNDRVLTNYIKCLLDKGACTREGRDLKSKYLLFFQPELTSSITSAIKSCLVVRLIGSSMQLF